MAKRKTIEWDDATQKWVEVETEEDEEQEEAPRQEKYGRYTYRGRPGMGKKFSGSRFSAKGERVPPAFGKDTATVEEYQSLRDAVKASVKNHTKAVRGILYDTVKEAFLRLGIGVRINSLIKKAKSQKSYGVLRRLRRSLLKFSSCSLKEDYYRRMKSSADAGKSQPKWLS